MNVPGKSELMHLQLQAWMREHSSDDIEYLGERNGEHYYRIAEYEVPVSCIEGLEQIA